LVRSWSSEAAGGGGVTRAAERFIYGDGAVASAKKGGGGSEAEMAERTRPGEKSGASQLYGRGPTRSGRM
jgi:hypothetical protein